MKITKEQLYLRQTTLNEIGENGQQKLQDAEILIVGCGGLGSVAAVYLAASGVGNIHLVDFDVVNVSNLHRQVFYKTEDIGKSKAEVLTNYIRSISPFVNVTYTKQAINKSNAIDIIDDFAIVVDCTDSLPTKYLLNDVCVITDTILIYGSLYKHDGYVATFNMTKDSKRTANLRDAFPEMTSQQIPNCSEIGTLNTIVGIIGMMQANEVIKIITHTGEPLMNQILIYNSLENSQFKMKLSSEPCYKKSERGCILKSFKHNNYDDPNCEIKEEDFMLSAKEFRQKIENEDLIIISLIEDLNITLPFHVNLKIPFSEFKVDDLKIDTDKVYTFVCKKGILSYAATLNLKEKYPDLNVYSLNYGIENY
ncbi:MAG: ThiF family adenylyltransferase [Bacteroidota bacterium]